MASSSWERRNARARSLGFRNYYDYRAHNYGRSPAKLAGEGLRMARGHAGPADLARMLRSGRVAVLSQEPVPDTRRADGRYGEVRVTAQLTDGRQVRFRLRGRQLTNRQLSPLRDAVTDAGTDVYTNPSLDMLFMVDRDDVDEIGEHDPETLAGEMEEFDAELGADE